MALTKDTIKTDTKLATLTDEQIAALETLSKNDEDAVIGRKIGELHGQYDQDILAASGLAKNQGEKSYEYAKRVIANLKSQTGSVTEIQNKLTAAETKVVDLEKKIKEGSTDPLLKQKLEDQEKLVTQLQEQMKTEKTTYEKKLQDQESAMQRSQFVNQMDTAVAGLKFKADTVLPISVRTAFIEQKKNSILAAFKPDMIDDGKGGKIQVLRDKSNEIYRNPENQLNPFTVQELMQKELQDILDGTQPGGGGTKPPTGGGGSGHNVDITAAKTQVQADEIIRETLMAKGLPRGTAEFNAEFTKIRTENKVETLPVK